MFKTQLGRLTKWLFIPCMLLLGGLILSILYYFNSDINPTVLSFNHSSKDIHGSASSIKGRFTAQENYLGIVTVQLNDEKQFSGDSVFRIKNILDSDWTHIATVAASQYATLPLYPFGLPIIRNSKNQTYEFEVNILNTNSAIPRSMLGKSYPLLISQYAFPKEVLISNKMLLAEFIYKKILYNLADSDKRGVFIVYSLPIFFYLFFLLFEKKINSLELVMKMRSKLKFLLNPYIFMVFLGIFIDIFIIKKSSDSTISLFSFLWILGVAAYKLESRYSFGMALIFLTFCPFLLSANMDWIAEKSGIWAYMFLVVGTFQALVELKAESSPRLRGIIDWISRALSFITYLDSFLKTCAKRIKEFALFSVRNFVKVVVAFIVVTTLFLLGFDFYLRTMSYLTRQSMNPKIDVVEPSLTYASTKVTIYGIHLGDNSKNKYALMRDGVKMRVDSWDDNKIIFTVPLEWKQPSEMSFWIEKPVNWNAETIIERTKPMKIKVLKVTGGFTPDDDLYFEQMKTWRKETLEINGYTNSK
ncbi:MAG: hypothetical protein WCL18_07470 [bacterium]